MDPIIILVATLLTGWLFLVAGWHKLTNPYYYGGVLANYVLLPPFLRHPLAFLLGVFEAAVGVAALLPVTRTYGGRIAAAMLLLYMIAMAASLLPYGWS